MVFAVYSSRAGGLQLGSEGQSCEGWMQGKNLQLFMLPTGRERPGKDNISTCNHNIAKAFEMATGTEDQKRLIGTLDICQLDSFFVLRDGGCFFLFFL